MRYVIHPGYVESIKEGDLHYVSFSKLVQLYGVKLGNCINVHSKGYRPKEGDIHLYPNKEGKYESPT